MTTPPTGAIEWVIACYDETDSDTGGTSFASDATDQLSVLVADNEQLQKIVEIAKDMAHPIRNFINGDRTLSWSDDELINALKAFDLAISGDDTP